MYIQSLFECLSPNINCLSVSTVIITFVHTCTFFSFDYIISDNVTLVTNVVCLRVRSFGMIRIRIGDPRSLGSWWIKGTTESTLDKDSAVPLKHHDPSHLGSLILIGIIPKERTLNKHDLGFDVSVNTIQMVALGPRLC